MSKRKMIFQSLFIALFFMILTFFGEKFFGENYRYKLSKSDPLSWQEAIANIPWYIGGGIVMGFIMYYILWWHDRDKKRKEKESSTKLK